MTRLPLLIADMLEPVQDAFIGDGILETALRGLLIYFFAMLLIKTGKSRMLSDATVFDVILAFILGAMLSRAINSPQTPLLATMVAAAILVSLHAGLARLSYHSDRVGAIVKGHTDVLVRDGEIDEDAMHDHHLGDHDLDEALHAAGLLDVSQVERAYFERDGNISIIRKARVLEVEVAEGVQRVRIEV